MYMDQYSSWKPANDLKKKLSLPTPVPVIYLPGWFDWYTQRIGYKPWHTEEDILTVTLVCTEHHQQDEAKTS